MTNPIINGEIQGHDFDERAHLEAEAVRLNVADYWSHSTAELRLFVLIAARQQAKGAQ